MKENTKIEETQLFAPVRDFFTGLGYEVHGEVGTCDLTATKEDELIIVELKRNLNLDLLLQGAKRQRLTSQVYIAILKPKYSIYSKKWKDRCYLVRRLELGLITVALLPGQPRVEVVFHPGPFDQARSKRGSRRKKSRLQQEIAGRHGNYNTGGSVGQKIMTAYKENALHIACCLQKYGPLSPKALQQLGTGPKTASILQKNFYGWFHRVARGSYQLTSEGRDQLSKYPELVAYYASLIQAKFDQGAEAEKKAETLEDALPDGRKP
ncbi:MAG TPA: hypothetical protein GXZ98_04660 [Firmicutes bacterium]|nr:hypothetical protein [Bacillota bacterium]